MGSADDRLGQTLRRSMCSGPPQLAQVAHETVSGATALYQIVPQLLAAHRPLAEARRRASARRSCG